MPPIPVKPFQSLKIPVNKTVPVMRINPGLPTEPNLHAFTKDLIAQIKYATAVAAIGEEATGELDSAIREYASTREPEAQEHAAAKARAILSSETLREHEFGRYSAINVSDYVAGGGAELMKGHMDKLKIDSAQLAAVYKTLLNTGLFVPQSPVTDADLEAGLAFKKLRYFITQVRCLEETYEPTSASDEINMGGIKVTPSGEHKIISEFVVSDDFDQGEAVTYAGLGQKFAGWNIDTGEPWPHVYGAAVCMAEKDNNGFYEFLLKLWDFVHEEVTEWLAGVVVGAAAGGSAGGVVGAIVGAVIGGIIGWIISLFNNPDDIVGVVPVTLSLGSAKKSYYDWAKLTSGGGLAGTLTFKGDGGHYEADMSFKVFTA